MHSWLRLYHDIINDPKVLKLPEATRWHYIAMLCIASMNDGILPLLDDIAIQLRVTAAKATEIIATLVKAGLLDKTETGFAPHNWNGRQYKSDVSTERVKRFRNGKRNVSSNVSETPPETEAETEAEKKDTREDALFAAMEAFWSIWPNKVGKPAALKALRSAVDRATISEICEGVENYIRAKPPDRPWLNPATFLNQNRWEDRPAAVGATNGKSGEISSACDNLIDRLNEGFGRTAPEEPSGGGTNEIDARLLAYGRG